jgi:hypothetical protein
MNGVVAWAMFAGAWLLVVGPLYQGAIELGELDLDREAILGKTERAKAEYDRPSSWWWLLPPVMYVLHRRWYKALKSHVVAHLDETQRGQMVRFQSKAAGWFTVAGGAGLLAAGQTGAVVRHYHWPQGVFWLLLVVMLAIAVLTPTVLTRGDDHRVRNGRGDLL